MGLWSRPPPLLTQEYQESVAHRVRDILVGSEHQYLGNKAANKAVNKVADKAAIKALQRPEALAGVIGILKTMPEPCHQADGWEADEGAVLNSQHNNDKINVTAMAPPEPRVRARARARAGEATAQNMAAKNKPQGTTIVAATMIATAAATTAATATIALTTGRRRKNVTKTKVEITDKTTTTTTTNTVVRFHPSKKIVSSHTYWWGYEIFIPQEALSRIASAQDVSSAFLGFLGSVGLMVPAIVPFLGYIAAYVGLEFAVIKAQNEGKGVILASTWLVPVALVPRAWDVPEDDGVDDNSGNA
ncbi:hypothetical protein BGX28_006319 [Mortierella sp. GBA30]|nr:hypothetical protein BGX28_006319 [Mortierella sp. GBA30]